MPNTPQAGRFHTYYSDTTPDPFEWYTAMRRCGINERLVELNRWPWNPLYGRHPLYSGIDPLRALRVLLFCRDADAVICAAESSSVVILALRRLFCFRPPVLLYDVSNRGWRMRDHVLNFTVRRADLVLALTESHKRYVDTAYPVKRPTVVIGYRIDEKFFRPGAVSAPADPREGGYVLAVGKDGSRDYDLLIEACRSLDAPLVILTDLPVKVPPELRDRVEIIGEKISFTRLRALYARAAVVALPLKEQDNPGGITALFEAMAMGKPIVATDTGATRDFLCNEVNGLMTAPGDAVGLRDALRRLLADHDYGAALGRAARHDIETRFSTARFAERRAAAIRDLVGELRRPGRTLR